MEDNISKCSDWDVSGVIIEKIISTNLSSDAEKSIFDFNLINITWVFFKPATFVCGMATPSPMAVVPSLSLSLSFSVICPDNSGFFFQKSLPLSLTRFSYYQHQHQQILSLVI